jgi:hypothetical protein
MPTLTIATDARLNAQELARHTRQRRAVEAVIWGMPAVNFELMYQAMVRTLHGTFNEVVHWSRLSDWRNQTLTPNPDAIYLIPFVDTTAGPMVLEIPPADGGTIVGTIMDSWQTPLEDVGTAGVDEGKGGRYLILPPDHKGPAPPGYIALPAATYYGYALLRSIPADGSDEAVASASAYGRRVRLYPLAQAERPPATVFHDAADVLYDAAIPYDWRFFQILDRFVQREVQLTRDKVMHDELRSIGLEKGVALDLDEPMKLLLSTAAADARALLDARYDGAFTPYFEKSRWALPGAPDYIQASADGYADPDTYPVDSRGLVFTFAFFTPKHLGKGQFYLMTTRDKRGEPLDGSRSYRLTVPTHAPVRQYWSATVYDLATHTLIRDLPRPSRSSQSPGLQANADGSVDVYFGPRPPVGKEPNWIPTDPDGEFEVLFRLYGPEKPLFDKSWKLPDLEKVK